ncbi:MAG: ABC transporter ATP-binding protein [Clostridia bacterium]|nr:ABC transporter ATP-binding protein [Clostridia bacterium]
MKYLLPYLRKYRAHSVVAPFFKMIEAVLDLMVPMIVAQIVDVGIAEGDRAFIISRFGIMIAMGLGGLACSIIAQYFAARAAVSTATGLRHDLMSHIEQLSSAEIDKLGRSTLITRMVSDVGQVQTGINMFLRLFLRSPIIVFGSVVMAFTINLTAALVFVGVVAVLTLIIFVIMKITTPMYTHAQQKLDDVTVSTRETLTGVRVVRAFGREASEEESFKHVNHELTHAQLHVGHIGAVLHPLTHITINIGIVLILWIGAGQVNGGILLSGHIIALVEYLTHILEELVKLAQLVVLMGKTVAGMGRINAVLNTKSSLTYGSVTQPAETDDAVHFEGVSFRYAEEADDALSDITLSIKRGETVGIIGSTGSGKSSLVSLITRFYDASEGKIEVLGVPVVDWEKAALHRRVAMVLQTPWLFRGTVRSNLTFGKPDATDEQMWRALDMARASEFVREKQGGLDFVIEQGARNLSGGQRQRLAIARALVTNPDILILDDSSASLDYATDAALRERLSQLPEHMSLIIVSERTPVIRYADKIFVLDDGRLVGEGSHEQLLESCEVYREIHHNSDVPEEGWQ